MTHDIDSRLEAALHRIAVAHVPDNRDVARTGEENFTNNDSTDLVAPAGSSDTANRRFLVGVAAGILSLAGIGALLVLAPRNDNPAAPVESPSSDVTPLDDVPPVTLGVTEVAPGVGQWLDLPNAPEGMTLVPGKRFEVSPVCAQIESIISGQTCVAISGRAQVAYSSQPTVIEVTTVFTTDTLDEYVAALVDRYPDPYQDQAVIVRGHPGRLLNAASKVVTWQERPGVIGQVRIVNDTANTDLVDLANTLIQRDWDSNTQLGN